MHKAIDMLLASDPNFATNMGSQENGQESTALTESNIVIGSQRANDVIMTFFLLRRGSGIGQQGSCISQIDSLFTVMQCYENVVKLTFFQLKHG